MLLNPLEGRLRADTAAEELELVDDQFLLTDTEEPVEALEDPFEAAELLLFVLFPDQLLFDYDELEDEDQLVKLEVADQFVEFEVVVQFVDVVELVVLEVFVVACEV